VSPLRQHDAERAAYSQRALYPYHPALRVDDRFGEK